MTKIGDALAAGLVLSLAAGLLMGLAAGLVMGLAVDSVVSLSSMARSSNELPTVHILSVSHRTVATLSSRFTNTIRPMYFLGTDFRELLLSGKYDPGTDTCIPTANCEHVLVLTTSIIVF